MNVRGRWLRKPTMWRKVALNLWSIPSNPTIYGNLEVDIGDLQQFLERRTEESGVRCTVTHAVCRALAIELRRHPECNVLVRGRRIWLRDDVDIFLQVAMPDPAGGDHADLSGATIRQADTKRVEIIARELREKAAAVRARQDGEMARTRATLHRLPNFLARWTLRFVQWMGYRLNLRPPATPRDAFGGAMVTSLGMLGIRLAYPPLPPVGRTAVLVTVGAAEDRPVARDGKVVVRPMCTITATLDHRVIDGFGAGILAAETKRLLEEPERLDLDPDAAFPKPS